ncbi:MAG: restriction endonuclease [Chloroflexi bacterium GWB2_49_20]|nr:MAG: restriction endonuclease [Chloroflexi bacterium GWB2_49_20]OGN79126.1 MAG: restriction endonuclease [Chloroflexi bacterium GWC2_49_37]OGN84922.1 MAG: restriction endonuclease [Chloroflexi bacterium GWD2_49_16]HCC78016.1 TdeIII family type II restriction endonuclease [Anaerolineae bacterium]HCM96632.1 TdeIII family type II restriction endonuclease [Anaerolineae bacterium]
MSISPENVISIESTIRNSLRKKLLKYNPESKYMPFHYKLLGKDRMALYSFVQSLNTTFGTSIFEPVAVALAKTQFTTAENQHVPGHEISEEAQKVIQNIINDLSTGKTNTNKKQEIELIREVCQKGRMNWLSTVKVDLFVQDGNDAIYLFDLKTVKPNISNFKDFKRTMLEWVAIKLAQDPRADVKSCIAIPYNPYEPEPYQRWTMKGMLDLKEELKVAEEFWDFLGGQGAYNELLNCFERVGIELRPEIDSYFSTFKA